MFTIVKECQPPTLKEQVGTRAHFFYTEVADYLSKNNEMVRPNRSESCSYGRGPQSECFPQCGASNDRLHPFKLTGNIKPSICWKGQMLGGGVVIKTAGSPPGPPLLSPNTIGRLWHKLLVASLALSIDARPDRSLRFHHSHFHFNHRLKHSFHDAPEQKSGLCSHFSSWLVPVHEFIRRRLAEFVPIFNSSCQNKMHRLERIITRVAIK